jgi:hypothetical protein
VVNAGVHTLPAEQYHADTVAEQPSLSASIAHLLVDQTPWHAWAAHPKLNPHYERVERDIFDLGNVAHQLILEGDAERVEVIDCSDWRTKDAKEQRDDARANGKVPLLRKDWERVDAMVTAVGDQLAERADDPPLFTSGKPEQTLVWEERGVTCRALVDWLRDDFATIDDLKTTGTTANPVVWSKKTLWSIGADVQAAMNLRGLKVVTGKDATFRLVVVENQPPYALSVVTLSDAALELANAKVDRAIDRWRHCLSTGRWPGYPAGQYVAELPSWAEYDFLEKDAEALTA